MLLNEVGQSGAVSETVTTPEIPTVQNVAASVEKQDITVTWDAFDGASRYKVYRYIAQEDGTFKLDNYGQSVSSTTFTDSGLEGSTEYKYEVQPLFDGQYKAEFSGEVTAVTVEINLAPVADSDIPTQELDVTADPLVVDALGHFSDPNGDDLTVSVQGVDNDNVTVESDGANVTITPRSVGTSVVTLVVTDPEGLSVEKTFNVTVNEVLPVQPTNVAAQALAYDKVEISFDEVSNADEYVIKRDGVEITRTDKTTFTDETVSGDSTYEYEVVAVNSVGESAAGTASVTTPDVPSVENVVATVDDTTVNLSWDAYEGANRYKVITYKKDEAGNFQSEGFGRTTSDTSFSFEELDAGAEYKFEIIPSVNWSYKPDFAGSTTAQIAEDAGQVEEEVVADSVENVQVALDGTKATVSWDQLTVDEDPITSYRVQLHLV